MHVMFFDNFVEQLLILAIVKLILNEGLELYMSLAVVLREEQNRQQNNNNRRKADAVLQHLLLGRILFL